MLRRDSGPLDPTTGLPPVHARVNHAIAARKASALTESEAQHLIACIRSGLPLDIHRSVRDGEGHWLVWTGERTEDVDWWRERCVEASRRDRGRR